MQLERQLRPDAWRLPLVVPDQRADPCGLGREPHGPRRIAIDHSHRRVGRIATGLDLARLRRMVVDGAPRAWRCARGQDMAVPGAQPAARKRLAGDLGQAAQRDASDGVRHSARTWSCSLARPARRAGKASTAGLWPVVSGAGRGREPPTCCSQDRSGSSTACWPMLSLQLTSDRSSSQCAPVRPSSTRWNDKRNDRPALSRSTDRRGAAGCPLGLPARLGRTGGGTGRIGLELSDRGPLRDRRPAAHAVAFGRARQLTYPMPWLVADPAGRRPSHAPGSALAPHDCRWSPCDRLCSTWGGRQAER
jgi:hypothetical protein